MKILTKTALITAAAALAACSNADAPQTSTSQSAPAPAAKMADKNMKVKTKAVLIYADWCGSCKVLDPNVKRAKALGDVPGLAHVKLDYTDKNEAGFYDAANAAGVGPALKAYFAGTIKTGQLVLVDMDDQKVIGKIDKTFGPAAMVNAMKEAAAES